MTKQRLNLIALWGLAFSLLAVAVGRYLYMSTSFEPQITKTATSQVSQPNSIAKVQNDALFGRPLAQRPKATMARPVAKKLPPLKIAVTGLIVSDVGRSIVMLRHSGISEALSEGDYLNMSTSVQVKKITASQVIFDRLGIESSIDVVPRKPNEQLVEVHNGNQVRYSVTDKRQRALLKSAFSDIKKSPHRFDHYFQWHQNDETVQLAPGSDPRLFTILPFQRGDQIVAVNDKRLPELTKQALAKLITSQSVLQIELLRDNFHHNIELVIN